MVLRTSQRGDIKENSTRKKDTDILDPQFLEAVWIPKVGQLVSIVENMLPVDMLSDVSEAVKLSSNLPYLPTH